MIDPILTEIMRDGVDQQLRQLMEHPLLSSVPELRTMLEYQLGMEGGSDNKSAQGKRLRPVVLLTSTSAVGGEWERALSAAAAVELMHNFSLIHDDIQDKSELRRGRPTVWVKWDTAQAINAGDAMLGMAQLALMQNAEALPNGVAGQLFRLFNRTLVELTIGQYLDLADEDAGSLAMTDYDRMVAGKTGALLAACFEMGAILGGAGDLEQQKMAQAGRAIGRAFQIQDDWLGIWGSEQVTGKSVHSDLMEKKKSYPIINGLNAEGEFARLWQQLGRIDSSDADKLADLLAKDGIKNQTEDAFRFEYDQALKMLINLDFPIQQKQPLLDLIKSILNRMK